MKRGRRVRGLYTPMPFVVPPAVAKRPGRVEALVQSVEHEVLGVTFWFDPDPRRSGETISIRISGQRLGVLGPTQPGDRFEKVEKVDGVIAGAGPVSVTARIQGINAGQWSVTARILDQAAAGTRGKRSTPAIKAEQVHRAGWSWMRWKLIEGGREPAKTTLLPFIQVPGVIPGFWTAISIIGFVVALAVQRFVIASDRLTIDGALPFSLLAIAMGLVGAKAWFVILRWRERRLEGWCIQGLIAGVALAAAIGFVGFQLPIGTFLDATTPGLFFGMAIGRVGCFFGGCCAGRPTASSWGIWSILDQRVGMRRIPTQWLESLLAFCVGLAALIVVLGQGTFEGGVFVAAVAAYTLVRQLILRLRGGLSRSARVTQLTVAAAAAILVADLLFLAIANRNPAL